MPGVKNMEIRQVVGLPKYTVSSTGVVFGVNGNPLTPYVDDKGYLRVYPYGVSHKRVHRLVAEAFIENTTNLPIVDHLNRNKKNNRSDNLRWATKSINNRNSITSLNAKSKYNGVFLPKDRTRWKVQIKINKVIVYLGCFEKEIEAAKAFNQFCIANKLNRELNIIKEV